MNSKSEIAILQGTCALLVGIIAGAMFKMSFMSIVVGSAFIGVCTLVVGMRDLKAAPFCGAMYGVGVLIGLSM